MPDHTCTVDGCEEKRHGRGLCQMHYVRLLRTGNLGPSGRKNFPAPEKCTVESCDAVPKAKGLCGKHLSRLTRHGDVNANPFKPRGGCQVIGCGRPHAAKGYCSAHYWLQWKHGGDPEPFGYLYAHVKIYRLRGAARAHACQHCGKTAAHWAYDHGDPGEQLDPRRGPFSFDPGHYLPLCASCHKIFDNGS